MTLDALALLLVLKLIKVGLAADPEWSDFLNRRAAALIYPTIYDVDGQISLSSCSTNFGSCYISGYNDLFLCEGCFPVRDLKFLKVESETNCACACCWYQYIQNYCFKQLCSDPQELSKLESYTQAVCGSSPFRSEAKPYKNLVEKSDRGIELFKSDTSIPDCSLLRRESMHLYDILGTIFDFDSLPQYEKLNKRNKPDISDTHDELIYRFEVYEKSDDEHTHNESDKDAEYTFSETAESNTLSNEGSFQHDFYTECIDKPASAFLGCNEEVTQMFQETELDYEETGYGSEVNTFYASSMNEEISFSEEIDNYDCESDDEDYDSETDRDDCGHDLESRAADCDINDINYDDQEYEDRTVDIDLGEDKYVNLSRRFWNKERFQPVFSGITSLRVLRDEISFKLVQSLFESLSDSPNEFFILLKSVFGDEGYKSFEGAYQESLERFRFEDVPQLASRTYCLGEQSNFLSHKFAYIEDMERGLEIGGCFVHTIVASKRAGLCPSTEHCSCKCAVTKGLIRCIESYGTEMAHLLEIGKHESIQFCTMAVQSSDDDLADNRLKINSTIAPHLDEEQIEDGFNFYNNLKSVAISLGISDELTDLKAEFLWDSINSAVISTESSADFSAAVVLQKCVLEPGDISDYLQLNLDSCDLRSLFYCKNHYKGDKCTDIQNENDPCDNACCLQMKMVECAKTHCASKTPSNKFLKVANLVCSKYTVPHNIADSQHSKSNEQAPSFLSKSSGDLQSNYFDSILTRGFYGLDSAETPRDYGGHKIVERQPVKRSDLQADDIFAFHVSSQENSDDLPVDAQISFGDYANDDKRMHSRICYIEEFEPSFDTANCDNGKVNTCIKEGIRKLKNDPEQFCPYCMSDNDNDECHCACCLGTYLSNVCYDPNCISLKENLRYKRYVTEICKTKPNKKYKRDLDDSITSKQSVRNDQLSRGSGLLGVYKGDVLHKKSYFPKRNPEEYYVAQGSVGKRTDRITRNTRTSMVHHLIGTSRVFDVSNEKKYRTLTKTLIKTRIKKPSTSTAKPRTFTEVQTSVKFVLITSHFPTPPSLISSLIAPSQMPSDVQKVETASHSPTFTSLTESPPVSSLIAHPQMPSYVQTSETLVLTTSQAQTFTSLTEPLPVSSLSVPSETSSPALKRPSLDDLMIKPTMLPDTKEAAGLGHVERYVTLEVPVTVTFTQTRYRPTTELFTEYESTFTAVTTIYDDTLTHTIAKKTLYRYKDITTKTETLTKSETLTKVRTKLIPLTTVTEIEESDQTVTSKVTDYDTLTETWYDKVTTKTETTFSGTDTTTAFKKTKIKYKKEGTTTDTTTLTETERHYRTKWYPEYTVTEFEEVVTKIKTKWYPYTTTEHSTTTTTTTTTSVSVSKLPQQAFPGRPTPPGFNPPFLVGREYLGDDIDVYTAIVTEVYEDLEHGALKILEDQGLGKFTVENENSSDESLDQSEQQDQIDVIEELPEIVEDYDDYNQIRTTSDTKPSEIPNTPEIYGYESSSNRPQIVSPITLFTLALSVMLVGLSLFFVSPDHQDIPSRSGLES